MAGRPTAAGRASQARQAAEVVAALAGDWPMQPMIREENADDGNYTVTLRPMTASELLATDRCLRAVARGRGGVEPAGGRGGPLVWETLEGSRGPPGRWRP